MDRIIIHGGKPLSGEVFISGSKNSTLPIMIAALLGNSPSTIKNVPQLRDVETMANVLRYVGAKVDWQGDTLHIDPSNFSIAEAPYDMVRKMRASIYVLGPMVAKLRRARVSFPGGCVIGQRPINLHLKGISALGVEITKEKGYINARADKLEGADISLAGEFGSSVGATCNVMMAATLAKGTTIIRCAAREPEVVELANFLNAMGARIYHAGSSTIFIEGVSELHGTTYTVIPDRIEAGTFMTAIAITRGNAIVRNCRPDHLDAVINKLIEIGVAIEQLNEHSLRVYVPGELKPTTIITSPYPGFPTDMQAQFTALLSLVKGESIIKETIFPERFLHCQELRRLGAEVTVIGGAVKLNGVEKLSGAPIMASDLRASAALVLAGLAAEGETEILRVYHIDRGYEKIEEKLQKMGADIYRYDPAKLHAQQRTTSAILLGLI